MAEVGQTMYRYEDVRFADGVRLNESVYRVLRLTPRGFWVARNLGGWTGHPRFVLADARKRFCCPTKAEALESFRARKRRQQGILEAQLKRCRQALMLSDQLVQEAGDG